MIPSRRLRFPLFSLLVFAVVSCADTKQWVASKIDPPPPPPAEKTSPPSRTAVDRAQRHLQAGDYQKALDAYNAGYQKNPHDKTLLSAYVQDVEYMAGTADQALERQDFGSAGKTYDILRKNYARFKGFEKQLSFTRTGLDEKLERCKKALFRQGFQEYRDGNLSQAIALWEALLVIDPHNTDIQDALRTARLQQKNLNATE